MNPVLNNSHLSLEWQTWIEDNLSRGCSVTSMIEIMVHSNFDVAFASERISRAHHDLITSAQYVHETPRFSAVGSNHHAGSQGARQLTFVQACGSRARRSLEHGRV